MTEAIPCRCNTMRAQPNVQEEVLEIKRMKVL